MQDCARQLPVGCHQSMMQGESTLVDCECGLFLVSLVLGDHRDVCVEYAKNM